MSETNEPRSWKHRNYSIFGPLLLIAIGVVLFLKTFGIIEGDLWGLFLRTWPLLFIVSGLDSIYRGDGYVGGVVWAGLGVMLLMGTLGFWQPVPWDTWLRLWPFLLIVWGLDILFHRKSFWSAGLGILTGVLILGAIYWAAVVSPSSGARHQETFVQPLQEVEQADIAVEMLAGKLWLGRGADAANLAEGELQVASTESVQTEYDVSGKTAEFSLKKASNRIMPFWFIGPSQREDWTVKLNPQIPLSVTSKVIIGEQVTNLSGLNVEDAELEVILGKSSLYLTADGDYKVTAGVIIGSLEVYVMEGIPVRIDLDTGMTSLEYPDDFERSGDTLISPGAESASDAIQLSLNLPVGSLRIHYID